MKCSLFTPTHKPDYLAETYRSVKAQGVVDIEWVIIPNAKSGDELPKIPVEIANDSRVRIYPFYHDGTPRVGELKRFACDKATGDIFVELDHDDMLIPGVLAKVVAAAETGGGFIYSDAASFLEDGNYSPWGYDERWGWETYDFKVYGKPCRATRNFPVTPKSLCEVYFAPDHVRCWTREAYYKAGGHDPNMIAGDDHDLICRSYITGAKFVHTGGCGYLYRHHPNNTVKSHQEHIQRQQTANRDKHFYDLVSEWLKREQLNYLDLTKKPVLFSNGKPVLQAKANSVGCIRAWDSVLPMIPRGSETDFMNECYRVLAPGGYFCAYFPSTEGLEAFAPHYKSFWNEHTFDYYTDKQYAKKLEGVKCRFQLVRRGTLSADEWRKRHRMVDTYVDLCALKGQRQPGRVHI